MERLGARIGMAATFVCLRLLELASGFWCAFVWEFTSKPPERTLLQDPEVFVLGIREHLSALGRKGGPKEP